MLKGGSLVLVAIILITLFVYLSNYTAGELEAMKNAPYQTIEYELPNPCGLIDVVCKDEVPQYTAVQIIRAIAQMETQNGKTGVGKSKNNLTGIGGKNAWIFVSKEESFDYSVALWERAYSHLTLEQGLAKWKTGNSLNTEPATIYYIKTVKLILRGQNYRRRRDD